MLDPAHRNLGYYNPLQTDLSNYFKSQVIDWITNKNNQKLLLDELEKIVGLNRESFINDLKRYLARSNEILKSFIVDLYILSKVNDNKIFLYDNFNNIIGIFSNGLKYLSNYRINKMKEPKFFYLVEPIDIDGDKNSDGFLVSQYKLTKDNHKIFTKNKYVTFKDFKTYVNEFKKGGEFFNKKIPEQQQQQLQAVYYQYPPNQQIAMMNNNGYNNYMNNYGYPPPYMIVRDDNNGNGFGSNFMRGLGNGIGAGMGFGLMENIFDS